MKKTWDPLPTVTPLPPQTLLPINSAHGMIEIPIKERVLDSVTYCLNVWVHFPRYPFQASQMAIPTTVRVIRLALCMTAEIMITNAHAIELRNVVV